MLLLVDYFWSLLGVYVCTSACTSSFLPRLHLNSLSSPLPLLWNPMRCIAFFLDCPPSHRLCLRDLSQTCRLSSPRPGLLSLSRHCIAPDLHLTASPLAQRSVPTSLPSCNLTPPLLPHLRFTDSLLPRLLMALSASHLCLAPPHLPRRFLTASPLPFRVPWASVFLSRAGDLPERPVPTIHRLLRPNLLSISQICIPTHCCHRFLHHPITPQLLASVDCIFYSFKLCTLHILMIDCIGVQSATTVSRDASSHSFPRPSFSEKTNTNMVHVGARRISGTGGAPNRGDLSPMPTLDCDTALRVKRIRFSSDHLDNVL